MKLTLRSFSNLLLAVRQYWCNNRNKYRYHTYSRYGFVRYADDFIITAPSKEDLIAIKPIVEAWLALTSLQLNQEKTRIVHIRYLRQLISASCCIRVSGSFSEMSIDDRFDFLGFNRHLRKLSKHCCD
jgi:hypothetical protein